MSTEPEPDPPLERAYRYRAGCWVMGCAVLGFALLGAGAAAFVPVGCAQMQNGRGWFALLVVPAVLFAGSMALLVVAGVCVAVRDAIRPPVLRVTPTALRLPEALRGPAEKDAQGNEVKPPPHPEEIPYAAIRWVRRETGATPNSARLMVVHDLSPATLAIEQSMMRPADFEELETVLRVAVPNAFTPAPPPATPPAEPE